jgi:hypothetical protein
VGPPGQRFRRPRVPARLRCERVCMGCGASLHHSRSAAIVDDSRPCAGRCIRFRRTDRPKNENPARASQRGGVSEPSVECIEIISCYEGSACETCRRHRGSCGNPREDTSSLFAPLKRAPCSHAADPASPKGKPHHWAKVVAGFPAPVLLGSEISFGATGATLAGGDVFRKPSRPDRITVSIRTLGAAK